MAAGAQVAQGQATEVAREPLPYPGRARRWRRARQPRWPVNPYPTLAARAQVAQGQATEVAHLSLVEVGGIRLLLLVNAAALHRLASRSAAFSL